VVGILRYAAQAPQRQLNPLTHRIRIADLTFAGDLIGDRLQGGAVRHIEWQ